MPGRCGRDQKQAWEPEDSAHAQPPEPSDVPVRQLRAGTAAYVATEFVPHQQATSKELKSARDEDGAADDHHGVHHACVDLEAQSIGNPFGDERAGDTRAADQRGYSP